MMRCTLLSMVKQGIGLPMAGALMDAIRDVSRKLRK
jgi:hypothetical protein